MAPDGGTAGRGAARARRGRRRGLLGVGHGVRHRAVRGTRDRSVPYGGCRGRCSSPSWSSRPPLLAGCGGGRWRRPPGHHRDGLVRRRSDVRGERRRVHRRRGDGRRGDERRGAVEPEDTGATQTEEAPPEDTTVDPSTVTVDLDPFTVQADDAERPALPGRERRRRDRARHAAPAGARGLRRLLPAGRLRADAGQRRQRTPSRTSRRTPVTSGSARASRTARSPGSARPSPAARPTAARATRTAPRS